MRLPRLDFPNARHHVMNRGARRADIFPDDDSRRLFLSILGVLPERFSVRVHGYALMPNHFHLLLESVTGELPRAMRHLSGEYSRRLNVENGWDGPVFRGRYRNRLVGDHRYWQHLLLYVHANPARAGLEPTSPSLWTSHPAYTASAERPHWLTTTELQAEFGSAGAYLDAYIGLCEGQRPAPADFDPSRLWSPTTTGTTSVPRPRDPLWSVADALADVTAITGQPPESVLRSPRAPHSNPANWLAAWWMSRRCGIDHGQIARLMGTDLAAVTRRIARVESEDSDDARLREWQVALWARRPAGSDGGEEDETRNNT